MTHEAKPARGAAVILDEPDPSLAGKAPRGRTIEQVARIVADAEEFGAASAARRHRMSPPGVAYLVEKWRRHPVVHAELVRRRPAIEAKVRGRVGAMFGDLAIKAAKVLGPPPDSAPAAPRAAPRYSPGSGDR